MWLSKFSKQVFSSSTILMFAGLLLLSFAGFLNNRIQKPQIIISKQDEALNINTDFLRLLSFGNKRLITDVIWIQTLIESDLEHYKKKDLNNWMYLRFNSIAVLDPKFYQNYLYGGQFLGIMKDDLEGANNIYKKGIENYPDDYSLNYFAGFLNYYEIGNFAEGLQYLEKIQDHPRAPVFIKSIINKLKFEISGNEVIALQLLNEHYQQTSDPHLKQKLFRDIYSLKAEMDLRCLNEKGHNCQYKDAEGNPYVFKKGQWNAAQIFTPYRLFRKKSD